MAVEAMSKRFQLVLDGIPEEWRDQPVEATGPVLKERWETAIHAASVTDPELTSIVETLGCGERVALTDGA
jgi:hypothetical protein